VCLCVSVSNWNRINRRHVKAREGSGWFVHMA